jgi:predicted nucleic-acid-binding protein
MCIFQYFEINIVQLLGEVRLTFDSRYFTKSMRSEIFVAVEIHIEFVWFLKHISVITDTL